MLHRRSTATWQGKSCMILRGNGEFFFSSRLVTLGCFVFTITNCLSLSLFTPFLLSPSPPQSTPRTCRVKGSWQKLYVILQESQLFFYTDHKAAKEQPGVKPLSVFPLLQAVVSPYNKEKYVFQVWNSAPYLYWHLNIRMFPSPTTVSSPFSLLPFSSPFSFPPHFPLSFFSLVYPIFSSSPSSFFFYSLCHFLLSLFPSPLPRCLLHLENSFSFKLRPHRSWVTGIPPSRLPSRMLWVKLLAQLLTEHGLIDWLVEWWMDWFDQSVSRSVAWSLACLTDWLIDWLIDHEWRPILCPLLPVRWIYIFTSLLPPTISSSQNQDFKDHPERYKGFDQLLKKRDGEQSQRFSSRSSSHKRK